MASYTCAYMCGDQRVFTERLPSARLCQPFLTSVLGLTIGFFLAFATYSIGTNATILLWGGFFYFVLLFLAVHVFLKKKFYYVTNFVAFFAVSAFILLFLIGLKNVIHLIHDNVPEFLPGCLLLATLTMLVTILVYLYKIFLFTEDNRKHRIQAVFDNSFYVVDVCTETEQREEMESTAFVLFRFAKWVFSLEMFEDFEITWWFPASCVSATDVSTAAAMNATLPQNEIAEINSALSPTSNGSRLSGGAGRPRGCGSTSLRCGPSKGAISIPLSPAMSSTKAQQLNYLPFAQGVLAPPPHADRPDDDELGAVSRSTPTAGALGEGARGSSRIVGTSSEGTTSSAGPPAGTGTILPQLNVPSTSRTASQDGTKNAMDPIKIRNRSLKHVKAVLYAVEDVCNWLPVTGISGRCVEHIEAGEQLTFHPPALLRSGKIKREYRLKIFAPGCCDRELATCICRRGMVLEFVDVTRSLKRKVVKPPHHYHRSSGVSTSSSSAQLLHSSYPVGKAAHDLLNVRKSMAHSGLPPAPEQMNTASTSHGLLSQSAGCGGGGSGSRMMKILSDSSFQESSFAEDEENAFESERAAPAYISPSYGPGIGHHSESLRRTPTQLLQSGFVAQGHAESSAQSGMMKLGTSASTSSSLNATTPGRPNMQQRRKVDLSSCKKLPKLAEVDGAACSATSTVVDVGEEAVQPLSQQSATLDRQTSSKSTASSGCVTVTAAGGSSLGMMNSKSSGISIGRNAVSCGSLSKSGSRTSSKTTSSSTELLKPSSSQNLLQHNKTSYDNLASLVLSESSSSSSSSSGSEREDPDPFDFHLRGLGNYSTNSSDHGAGASSSQQEKRDPAGDSFAEDRLPQTGNELDLGPHDEESALCPPPSLDFLKDSYEEGGEADDHFEPGEVGLRMQQPSTPNSVLEHPADPFTQHDLPHSSCNNSSSESEEAAGLITNSERKKKSSTSHVGWTGKQQKSRTRSLGNNNKLRHKIKQDPRPLVHSQTTSHSQGLGGAASSASSTLFLKRPRRDDSGRRATSSVKINRRSFMSTTTSPCDIQAARMFDVHGEQNDQQSSAIFSEDYYNDDDPDDDDEEVVDHLPPGATSESIRGLISHSGRERSYGPCGSSSISLGRSSGMMSMTLRRSATTSPTANASTSSNRSCGTRAEGRETNHCRRRSRQRMNQLLAAAVHGRASSSGGGSEQRDRFFPEPHYAALLRRDRSAHDHRRDGKGRFYHSPQGGDESCNQSRNRTSSASYNLRGSGGNSNTSSPMLNCSVTVRNRSAQEIRAKIFNPGDYFFFVPAQSTDKIRPRGEAEIVLLDGRHDLYTLKIYSSTGGRELSYCTVRRGETYTYHDGLL
ncbi:unnamed protein product [Amoebophrya sp. A120]|nr:unnamed protein product [Amoebophrya sp. A120]|eukprot:GSA120T00006255001.1